MPMLEQKALPKYGMPLRRTAVILGNGPSLRGFDFRWRLQNYDVFGMNLAYRYWDTINWYPTYYSCLDRVVGMAHLEDILRLVENASAYGIRRFLLRGNVVEALNLEKYGFVYNFDKLVADDHTFFRGDWASTGSLTTAWAGMLGYRRLILLGMDASYVKYVDGAAHVNEMVLKIENQPVSNPNYFFDDYQRAGDVYHVPFREHPEFPQEDQLMGWHMIRPQLHNAQVTVVNANPCSRVDAFPKCSLEDVGHALTLTSRREKYARNTAACSPEYEREQGCSLDTMGLAADLCRRQSGVFFDIGAHHGETSLRFLQRGWTVYALEPDPENRAVLRKNTDGMERIFVEGRPASCVADREYPWFKHAQDDRLHAMKGFSNGSVEAGLVSTTTIRRLVQEHKVKHSDILCCDVVGFEFMALRGAPLDVLPPDCIVCSWDNGKSMHLGSDMHDLGSMLLAYGYHVFMSEWHPELDGPFLQQWRRMIVYPAEPRHPQAWGHFLAFRRKPRRTEMAALLQRHVHIGSAMPPSPLPPLREQKKVPYILHY